MKKRIFINIHYLEIGGAERALLGLLAALDPEKVDVDLFVNQHTGEFMPLIPDYVNLLPEIPEYTCIERPIKDVFMEGHWNIALRRMWAKYKCRLHTKPLNLTVENFSIFNYVAEAVDPVLPSLYNFGEYDLAISFLQPHLHVLNKVKAKKKICWIHTDYSKVYINKEKELPIWDGYDYVASISDDCTTSFLSVFPELTDKIVLIENILSPLFVRQQSELENVSLEMPDVEGEVKILTIGRYCLQKRIEKIPEICVEMEKLGINFKWYIIGFGPDEEIQRSLDACKMRHRMILLGKKSNPYPYIKACDIYAQPSEMEGKSVTVREAQMLYKPTVITNYPTSGSQITSGVDGFIVPMDVVECAKSMSVFIKDKEAQSKIIDYLKLNDFGNESEVEKIYSLLS